MLCTPRSITGRIDRPNSSHRLAVLLVLLSACCLSSFAGLASAAAQSVSPPLIIAQPVSQAVTAGQTATFSVTATGAYPMTYQWMENGNPLQRRNVIVLHNSAGNNCG